MKKLLPLLLFLIYSLTFPTLSYAQENTPLQGTWKLVKSKWGKMKKLQTPTQSIYKIFTKKHFYFIYYDNEEFSGAGGGTYTIDEQTFTETLDYFSWDSTATKTNQTYNWTIEGNILHQSGFIKGTDEYDDYIIEEYYEKVEEDASLNESLTGVWQIEKGTYGDETNTAEENRWTIRKIFTPTFWYAAFYDARSGSFNGIGFGTYKLKQNQYIETLSAYSWDQSAVGKTYTFTMDIQPETLIQSGMINSDKYKDYKIEEYFKRVE